VRSLTTLARRFAVLCSLGLWIGGTTLYTGFVIRIGHRLIPGGTFGRVTRDVTGVIQVIGLVTLSVLLVNLLADWRASRRLIRWGTAGSWAVCALTLGAQFALRWTLLGLMDSPVRDRFESAHETYEMMTAIQWGAAMFHGGCVLAAWRGADTATRDRTG
jgi:hypothetical protein